LTGLSATEWRTLLARLRRARLLAGEDPHHPGQLDAHPLVREYFGDQLGGQRREAWQEGNRRLYEHYRELAPPLPDSFQAMEPLFLAVICGCQAGLLHDALHEVYLPRIQRGNASFTANVLGARGALLSVLVHFFEHGRWGALIGSEVEGQSLTADDQLFILMQAALYLTATRGFAAPEIPICYERVESLCQSLNRPLHMYSALMGHYRYSLVTDRLTATMQIAKRVYSTAQEQNDRALMVGAYRAFAATLYFMGDFESARQNALRGVQIWRAGVLQSVVEEVIAPAVGSLCFEALSEWHLAQIDSCKSHMAEAILLAKELNHMHALAVAFCFAGFLGHFQSNPAEVESFSSNLIELSTRHNFTFWLHAGEVLRGWARSVSGDTTEGIAWIEHGIENMRAAGWTLCHPYALSVKAEALHLADRTSEALEALSHAEALAERSEERWWCAELNRLRGVFSAAIGADETPIKASFHEAIRMAKEQKSISLAKRAEASYAEYRNQKMNASGECGLRIRLL
jgi:hypothetical protein